ncbi:NifU family protein [Anaeroselena agilis]|uniref:NifU family protein n=1 Tax=Anaeroselena agilis TaxID=3063788 RepID=A0ABU3P1I7_9FIRM|nr:NifU family protein [Selenomonadales bacterium 4137-cl]
MDKLGKIIDQQVRPALRAHGGDIELVELTADGVLKVRLTGACATCPGAQQTLADVVAAALKEAAPEVREIVPVFQADEELIRQALAILRKGKESRDG